MSAHPPAPNPSPQSWLEELLKLHFDYWQGLEQGTSLATVNGRSILEAESLTVGNSRALRLASRCDQGWPMHFQSEVVGDQLSIHRSFYQAGAAGRVLVDHCLTYRLSNQTIVDFGQTSRQVG